MKTMFKRKNLFLGLFLLVILNLSIVGSAKAATPVTSQGYADGKGPVSDTLSGNWLLPYSTTYDVYRGNFGSNDVTHYEVTNYMHTAFSFDGNQIGYSQVYVWIMWVDNENAMITVKVLADPQLMNGNIHTRVYEVIDVIDVVSQSRETILDWTPNNSFQQGSIGTITESLGVNGDGVSASWSYSYNIPALTYSLSSNPNTYHPNGGLSHHYGKYHINSYTYDATYQFWNSYYIQLGGAQYSSFTIKLTVTTIYLDQNGHTHPTSRYIEITSINPYNTPSGGGSGGSGWHPQ